MAFDQKFDFLGVAGIASIILSVGLIACAVFFLWIKLAHVPKVNRPADLPTLE